MTAELVKLITEQDADEQADTEQEKARATAREARKRESVIDLADARSALGMSALTTRPERERPDQRGTDKVPVGDGFASNPWETVADDADPADHGGKPRLNYTRNQDVSDLVASGHGFLVRREGSRPNQLEHCRYCGDELPLPPNPCEFGEMGDCWIGKGRRLVKTTPRKCRCNGCQAKVRNRGGQPVQCGKTECYRAMRREQKRTERERKRVALNA